MRRLIVISSLALTFLNGCATVGKAMLTPPAAPASRILAAAAAQPGGIDRLAAATATSQGAAYTAEAMTLRPTEASRPARKPNRFTCVSDGPALDISAIGNIELSFTDANIRDVLAELSMQTGMSVVLDESVEGLVSVNISNSTLADALDIVLASGGYSYKAAARHILIGPADPRSRSFAQLATTCVFKPENASPDQLVQALPPIYQTFVRTQTESRHLTITAPMDMQRRIQSALLALDQAPDQVLLEMSIIEVSVKAMDILGVSWSKTIKDTGVAGNARQLGLGEWSGVQAMQTSSLSGPLIQTSTTPSRSLAESVQMLRGNGQAEVKAMPSIVTRDGKQANFSSQATAWLPFDNVSGSSDRKKELTYGINMTVIPKIANSGDITLEIKEASVSDLVEDEAGAPRIVSHQISSTVDIRDGDTLVLGGLFRHKQRKQSTGLPGLSRLKGVGNLFGQTRNQDEETEVLIMIRPRILNDG
ncbi:MAG TPA: secretin and TonB N-terminal domain-containing protein [Fluviicoccus sp.]|nr:secretin and TonB N-terminal domain-containing protein [Fluviicoccus sp.]